MNHYKSWSMLNQQLSGLLCEELKNHLSYFLTRYHKVHNSYGRAAIRLDNRELVCFSWVEMYDQEYDLHEKWKETGVWDYEDQDLKSKWDENATYYEMDFLAAAVSFCKCQLWRHSTAIIILSKFLQSWIEESEKEHCRKSKKAEIMRIFLFG